MAGTLLVERDGTVILNKGYGVVDRGKKTRATAATPYLLGSLSKQFTAAAIYKLESQGKLHLAIPSGSGSPTHPPTSAASRSISSCITRRGCRTSRTETSMAPRRSIRW
jgi:CubicO group peptidase (beta-lactamase class C family)